MKKLKKLAAMLSMTLAITASTQVMAADLTIYWDEYPQMNILKYNTVPEEYVPLTFENVIEEFKAAGILDANNNVKIEKYDASFGDPYRAVGNENSTIQFYYYVDDGYLFDIKIPHETGYGPSVLFYTKDFKTATLVPFMDSRAYGAYSAVTTYVDGAYWISCDAPQYLSMSFDMKKWFYNSGYDGTSDTMVTVEFLSGKPYLKKGSKYYEAANPELSEWNEVPGMTEAWAMYSYVLETSPEGWKEALDIDGASIKLVP